MSHNHTTNEGKIPSGYIWHTEFRPILSGSCAKVRWADTEWPMRHWPWKGVWLHVCPLLEVKLEWFCQRSKDHRHILYAMFWCAQYSVCMHALRACTKGHTTPFLCLQILNINQLQKAKIKFWCFSYRRIAIASLHACRVCSLTQPSPRYTAVSKRSYELIKVNSCLCLYLVISPVAIYLYGYELIMVYFMIKFEENCRSSKYFTSSVFPSLTIPTGWNWHIHLAYIIPITIWRHSSELSSTTGAIFYSENMRREAALATYLLRQTSVFLVVHSRLRVDLKLHHTILMSLPHTPL
jgi:hypothetical protein